MLRFTDLTAEIRNDILTKISIVPDSVIDVVKFRLERESLGINAALGNEQLLHEYTRIFYGSNVFSFSVFNDILGPDKLTGSRRDVTRNMPLALFAEFDLERLNPKGRGTYGLRLPPLAVRRLMKNVQLIITAPHSGRMYDQAMHFTDTRYDEGKIDWLYALRELNALGFFQLETLAAKIGFGTGIDRKAKLSLNEDCEVGLRAWVMGQAALMQIDAVKVDWVFERFGSHAAA